MDDKLTLVRVVVWCREGNEPLPEPMLIKFYDTISRHQRHKSQKLKEKQERQVRLHVKLSCLSEPVRR